MAHNEKFILFGDYLQNPDPRGWVTVSSRTDWSQKDSRFVFAALASPDSVPALLKTPAHEVNSLKFGTPTFEESDGGTSFRPHGSYSADVRLEPFVFKRIFHGVRPDTHEIAQSFVLYHELFFDHEQNAYADPDGDPFVRVSPSCMQVREDALRDYLAARGMVLVLYYHHRRWQDMQMADVFGADRLDVTPHRTDSNYRLEVGHFLDDKRKSLSILLGKRIVRPYAEPLHADYGLALGRANYETYVCSENGERVEKSCDPESELRRGPNPTSVFFEKEVVSKYRNSSLYDVSHGNIRCLDLWGLDFEEDDELVRVWLGDLGRIPYKEQRYWRLHNVMPPGGLLENFARSGLPREFTKSRPGCIILMELKSQVNANFERRFGFRLFKNLRSRGTRAPHDLDSDDESEFNEQILSTAKSLVESINQEDLKPGTKPKPNMSISTLKQFLAERGLAAKTEEIVGAFHMVQRLRSTGAAHAGGQAYEKVLEDYGLDQLGPSLRFATVIEKLSEQLSALNAWLESDQS